MIRNKTLIFTVGLGSYLKAGRRLINALTLIDIDKIEFLLVDDIMLKSITKQTNFDSNVFNKNLRGYGFWRWKPFLIHHFLQLGYERIIYLDAGCEVNPYLLELQISYFEENCKFDLILSRTYHSISQYTKPSVIDYFKREERIDVDVSKIEMCQFGVSFIKNTRDVAELFQKAVKYFNYQDGFLYNDDQNCATNFFVDHRHDQSVLNLLLLGYCSKVRAGVINSSLTPPDHFVKSDASPAVIASRNISYVSIYNLLMKYGEKKQIPKLLWLLVKSKRLLATLFFGAPWLLSLLNKYSKDEVFVQPEIIDFPIEIY